MLWGIPLRHLTLELSGGVAVRLERDVRRQHGCATVCEHDSAALKAQQCRVDSGLREESDRLRRPPCCHEPRAPRGTKARDATTRAARDTRPCARNTATQAGPN